MKPFLVLLLSCLPVFAQEVYTLQDDGSYLYAQDIVYILRPYTNLTTLDWAAVRAKMEIRGNNSVRDASAFLADLTLTNGNVWNRGQGIVSHVGTLRDTPGAAQYLAGFRTSLDHRSSGNLDTMVAYDAPQVDIEGAGGIKFVYGFRALTLSGAGKTNVYPFASYDWNGTQFFAGPTAIGQVDSVPHYHTHASAYFEVASTNRGVLLPRMTKAQRDAIVAPATGLEIYQLDATPGKRCFNGSAWVRYTETTD